MRGHEALAGGPDGAAPCQRGTKASAEAAEARGLRAPRRACPQAQTNSPPRPACFCVPGLSPACSLEHRFHEGTRPLTLKASKPPRHIRHRPARSFICAPPLDKAVNAYCSGGLDRWRTASCRECNPSDSRDGRKRLSTGSRLHGGVPATALRLIGSLQLQAREASAERHGSGSEAH